LEQELELVVFKKHEGLVEEKKNLSNKYSGVFMKEHTGSFNQHAQQILKEWGNY